MKRYLPLVVSLFALAVPATAGATTFGAEVNADFTSQSRGLESQSRVQSNLNSLYKAGGRVGRADSNWAGTEPKAPVHGKGWASPVVADGKLYAVNEEGTTAVIELTDEHKVLAANALGEKMLATPAVAGGALFLRSDQHLWCVAEKKDK